MNRKIAVCIKSVPDPDLYGSITLDPVTKTLRREGVKSVVNPADKHAIELAIQLKEQFGATVTLLSMGPDSAQRELREGLSYGADAAFLLSDRKFGGADSLATSYVLAQGLEKAGPFDLILTGNESADGATTHVPSQIGEWLGLPHIMDVVVAGGLGIRNPETWEKAKKLAAALDGAVGYTRPLIDLGLEKTDENMIGASGKSVRPKLYLAFGISGASHHVCGMKDSGLVLSVNRDENAEIFHVSDYKVVADCGEILDALLKELDIS